MHFICILRASATASTVGGNQISDDVLTYGAIHAAWIRDGVVRETVERLKLKAPIPTFFKWAAKPAAKPGGLERAAKPAANWADNWADKTTTRRKKTWDALELARITSRTTSRITFRLSYRFSASFRTLL